MKRLIWMSMAMWMGCQTALAAQSSDLMVTEIIRQSQQAAVSNNLAAALDLAKQAVAADPAYAGAWKQHGDVLMRMDKYPEAEQVFRACIRMAPKDSIAWRWLGVALVKQGRKDEALACLQEAIKLNPAESQVSLDVAWIYWDAGRQDEAIVAFRNVLAGHNPAHSNTVKQVVASVAELGRADAAIELYRAWDPSASLLALGQWLVKRGRVRGAEVFLERAWIEKESQPVAGLYLANVRLMRGFEKDVPEMLSVFAGQLQSAAPHDVAVFIDCLRLGWRRPELVPVITRADPALAGNAEYEIAVMNLLNGATETCRANGEDEKALALLAQIMKRNPNSTSWIKMADVMQNLGRVDEIRSMLTNLVATAQQPAVTRGAEGRLAELDGQWQVALNAYQDSMAADSAQPDMRRRLFRCFLNLGMLEEATGEAEYTATCVENGTYAMQADLAEMWSLLRRYDMAIPEWRKLRLLTPEVQYYGLELAQALFNGGRAEEAIAVLKEMLETNPGTRVYESLTEICSFLGRYNEAFSWAQQGLAKKPTRNLRRNFIENAEALSKIDSKVLAVVDEYLTEDPGYPSVAMFKGNALMQAGKSDAAFKVAQSLLARNPEHMGAAVLAKDAGVDTGRLNEALDISRLMVARRPWDVDRRREYAILLSQDEKFSQSESILLEQGQGNPVSATAVLVYQKPTPFNYGGMNSVSQIVSHIASLAGVGVRFVMPEDMARPEMATQRRAMVVLVDADDAVVRIVDAALQRYGACAVYAAESDTLSRRIPGKPTPAALTALSKNGRWRLAVAGPTLDRVAINSQNVLGNPFTHGVMANGALEDVTAFSNRLHTVFSGLAALLPSDAPRVMVYPGGDYGQSSLDCGLDYLQTLRRVVASTFTYAVFFDDSGFFVPRAEVERVPGRVIPPTWQGTNLLAHIYQRNPFTRVKLDLAKSYYWQRQYERAMPWFEAARQAGADPVEIDFNQGRALYLQDDIAGAKRLLQSAYDQDPGSERIKNALSDADNAWAGSATAFAAGWSDNDDRDYFKYGAEAETRIYSQHWRVGATVDRNYWAETNATEEATRVGVSGTWNIAQETRLIANLWYLDMDSSQIDGQWGGAAILHVPNRWLSGYVEGGYEAFEMETVSGLRRDIKAQLWRLDNYAFLAGCLDWDATLTHQDNTDSNQIDMFDTILLYRFKESPYVELGIRVRLADSTFDAPEYWSPQSSQQYQLHVATRGTRGRYRCSLSGDAGYVREEQKEWQFLYGGKAVIETPIVNDRLHLVAMAGHFEGPSYKRTSASLSLRAKF